MMRSNGYLMAGLCALALGCTKVNPNFNTLDQNVIPQPLFAGLNVKEISTQSSSQTSSIQGQCDPRITALTAAAQGINSTQSINTVTSGIAVNCAGNGTFSFTLNSLSSLGYTIISGTDNTT